MKTCLLVLTILYLSTSMYCQEPATPKQTNMLPVHRFGDFSISGSANLLLKTPNGVQFAGGIKLRTFLSKKISFDSDLVFSRDYIHGGPGLIGIPIWLLFWHSGDNSDDEGMPIQNILLNAALILLSAEHVSYHIPVKNVLDISPYISLLRYKSSYKYGDYSNPDVAGEQFSFALGVELNKYLNRFVLSPYAELNVGYTDHIPGYNIGVYCGYYFPVR